MLNQFLGVLPDESLVAVARSDVEEWRIGNLFLDGKGCVLGHVYGYVYQQDSGSKPEWGRAAFLRLMGFERSWRLRYEWYPHGGIAGRFDRLCYRFGTERVAQLIREAAMRELARRRIEKVDELLENVQDEGVSVGV